MKMPESYNILIIQECTDLLVITQHRQHIYINNKYTIHTHITQQILITNT